MIKIRDSPKSAPSKSRSVPLNPETAPLSWHSIQISISILEIHFSGRSVKILSVPAKEKLLHSFPFCSLQTIWR